MAYSQSFVSRCTAQKWCCQLWWWRYRHYWRRPIAKRRHSLGKRRSHHLQESVWDHIPFTQLPTPIPFSLKIIERETKAKLRTGHTIRSVVVEIIERPPIEEVLSLVWLHQREVSSKHCWRQSKNGSKWKSDFHRNGLIYRPGDEFDEDGEKQKKRKRKSWRGWDINECAGGEVWMRLFIYSLPDRPSKLQSPSLETGITTFKLL